MPFEPTPITKTSVNPWVAKHPKEALALQDLADYVRRIPDHLWYYGAINDNNKAHPCETIGCALGHAPFVESCENLGIYYNDNADVKVKGKTLMSTLPDEAFNMPNDAAAQIFYGGGACDVHERCTYGVPMRDVTQDMVADRIDHWLLTGEIR